MGNISKELPTDSATVQAIYAWHKDKPDKPREYLGASAIGHECERYLWFCFLDCVREDFDGRMLRLFETGHLAEERFVAELRGIGCEVHDTDERGQQFAVTAIGGHFKGHMDGVAQGIPEAPKTWHVLEFKTHSAKSFAKLIKSGVQEAKPQHFAQMMVYMHLTGLKRALYLAANKDTDALYTERIRYDAAQAEALMARAERIITAKNAPPRCSDKPEGFPCRFCAAQRLCWGSPDGTVLPVPAITCRQCCHSTAETDDDSGRWTCARLKEDLPRAAQLAACPDHLILPDLIQGAEPTDATDSQIVFGDWTTGPGAIPSTALMSATLAELPGWIAPNTLVSNLDAPPLTIVERYPIDDARTIWQGLAFDLASEWWERYSDRLDEICPEATQSDGRYEALETADGRVAIIDMIDGNAWILEGVE